MFRQKGPKPLTPHLALGEQTDANLKRAVQLAWLKQGPPAKESVPPLGQTEGVGAEPMTQKVAEAQGGVAQLVEKAKLNRESLYKILSQRGNPELKSLDALLHALGFRLAVTASR